jgi:drug/metabolite transporter (DMT)-like permease
MLPTNLSDRGKGILLSLGAVLSMSPDTLLIRKASEDVNFATLLFYRYAFHAFGVLLYVVATEKENILGALKQMGWIGVLCGIVLAVSNILFTMAVDYTFVANVLVILACNPLFAALFSWMLVGAVIQRRTAVTMLISLGAVALIFFDQVGGDGSSRSITGNIFAVCSAVLFGLFFSLVHYAEHLNGGALNMVPANIVAGVFIAISEFLS